MTVSTQEFVQDLLEVIQAKRTFGRHPLWLKIMAGELTLPQMQTWAVQFFLQVREFPRAVSAMHANCPFTEERIKLAESLFEEETGKISGCDLPHPELFIRFGEGLGLSREQMVYGEPLPATATLINWFELSTKQRSFIEGAAAINLAAEGQVPGNFGAFARALEEGYGLTRAQVAFWDIHEEADKDHSDVGDHIVVRHAATEEWQQKVRLALNCSLDMWWQFFEGVEQAVGAF